MIGDILADIGIEPHRPTYEPIPGWTLNPHPYERRVPAEIRELGYPEVEVITEGNQARPWVTSPVMAFIGWQVISHYRLIHKGAIH